jgi:hypothetical protein
MKIKIPSERRSAIPTLSLWEMPSHNSGVSHRVGVQLKIRYAANL